MYQPGRKKWSQEGASKKTKDPEIGETHAFMKEEPIHVSIDNIRRLLVDAQIVNDAQSNNLWRRVDKALQSPESSESYIVRGDSGGHYDDGRQQLRPEQDW